MLRFYSGSSVRAIVDAYPEIGLSEHKFRAVPSKKGGRRGEEG